MLGYGGWNDAVYGDVELRFVAGAGVNRIVFEGVNLQGVGDESWGLDNVRVSAVGGAQVYGEDFEDGAGSEWSQGRTEGPVIGNFSRYSGRFSQERQVLELNGLSAGVESVLRFEQLVID